MRPMTRGSSELSSKVTIGLVQVNNSFSGQNYLPYSLGCLRSYVEAHAAEISRYEFLPMLYKRMPVKGIVEQLKCADIVGFSTYVWNANISLEAARRLKAINKEMLIIFGGPQVPDKPEDFLRRYPFIDLVVHNEGEKTFLDLLENFPGGDLSEVPGISFIGENDRFCKTTSRERMRDLTKLPSPFQNGVFDSLILENPEEKWIGLWETNRGCPFQCTFCDWGSATAAKVGNFELNRLYDEIKWFAQNKIEYIFVCDANFGMLKRDIDIAQKVADYRTKTGYPQGFSVQSTKNATKRAYLTQKILTDSGLNKGVALSMQSLDNETLKNIKRDNISLDTYLELSNLFAKDGVETYSDLILGLPGETYDSYAKGIETLISAGQHNRIQFNNLSILPNAEMGDPEYLSHFKMKIVRSQIVNIHGSREILEDDVMEMQDLVVATYSMNEKDWRRARALSWMIAFLYFDKLVQIPIAMLRSLEEVPSRAVFEKFMDVDAKEYPVIGRVRDLFLSEALSIQQGGLEYKFSDKWLNIYWPADEYAYIDLVESNLFDDFYKEVKLLLYDFCSSEVIKEAVELNQNLVSRPFIATDTTVKTTHNVYECWQSILEGQPADLKKGEYSYRILRSQRHYTDFQLWNQEVVWWGNKKGAYLYSVENLTGSEVTNGRQLAGHF
jgi:radical SAM superfamily enzyme YgiQ (UPF0313 family)